MLDGIVRHDQPFPCLTVASALPEDQLAALRAAFEVPRDWARHESFYQCHMATLDPGEVERLLPAGLPAALGAALGVPLAPALGATLQRMEVGDHALPHTDRPLLGYEAARLVVQLNEGWTHGDGGLFQALDDAAGVRVAWERLPHWGSGVAFVMTPTSHHAVTPTRRTRRTVVVNLWHAGNTDDVARCVHELLDGARPGLLPRALAGLVDAAEARYPDATTWRATLAAVALVRWGCGDDVVAAGYRAALGEPAGPMDEEAATAVALAGWMARLRTEDFDADGWAALRARLDPGRPGRSPGLQRALERLFPA